LGSTPTRLLYANLLRCALRGADLWPNSELESMLLCMGFQLNAAQVGALVSNAEHLGWRWTQWITLILAAFFGTLNFVVVPETYAPVLLARRAKRLRHETGNWALHAKHEERKINVREIGDKYDRSCPDTLTWRGKAAEA